eukprot:CAMPEP_0180556860 /NCGR_PEP_ID=MMETSP1037_2-20121125/839_1 /TAXON_ID=632150 /ORGANISM="Azadinium spinosum, Strain 3D9" /LENGTH=52 /DNA_ID=CAMNT_0022572995 /DNA_START=18 /DNA_END=176 /DNA_ORIENTATION=+
MAFLGAAMADSRFFKRPIARGMTMPLALRRSSHVLCKRHHFQLRVYSREQHR